MNQKQTPLADALSANSQEQFIPFDVPGHKGNIIELQDFFGERAISLDKTRALELTSSTSQRV